LFAELEALVTHMKLPSARIVPSEFKTMFATLAFGLPKCGVLVTLNASARNCRPQRSDSRKLRNKATSALTNPGPRRMFLPEVPNRTCVMLAKASGSKNGMSRPMAPNFCTSGFTWSAVWLLPGELSEALEALTVNGVPL